MPITLNLKNVSKSFSGKPVIENTSFSFQKGCYCFTGPNGIGKTTILDLFAGVQMQDQGNVTLINGICSENTSLEYKKNLCYVPAKSTFFPSATGLEFLNFIISIKGHANDNNQVHSVTKLIQQFKIERYLDTRFSEMSLGTQKKFFLTTLVMGNNQLIILDEPTNGLDMESNIVLTSLLNNIKSDAIIIMASHDQCIVSGLTPNIIKLHTSPVQNLIISEYNNG